VSRFHLVRSENSSSLEQESRAAKLMALLSPKKIITAGIGQGPLLGRG